MRDKLIQILSRTKPTFNGQRGQAIRNVLDAKILLSQLRCDACKHWGAERYNGEPSGTCETIPNLDDYIWTSADFFCAMWEPKA